MRTRALLALLLAVAVLSGCSPATGSVTGITRDQGGNLEAVVLTCEGTTDSVGIETDGDPNANTDFVWLGERTRGTLRLTLTSDTLSRGDLTEENDLLGENGFTSEVIGYDSNHNWNSIRVPLTAEILAGLQHGEVTYGNPARTVTEDEFAAQGCALVEELYR